MKKRIFIISLLMLISSVYFAQIFIAKTCEVSFFSSSPLENIEAHNKMSKPLINTSTNDVQAKIPITGFVFRKPLMQEHFNENYMESEKYPNTIFKGKINEKINWKKDGLNKVTVTGIMSMHGVDKEITINGTVSIKGEEITISTKFMVHITDYGIKVPTIYVENIAEDVEVKLDAVLIPYKK